MRTISILSGALAAFVLAGCAALPETAQAKASTIFRISDIHFDPFYSCHADYNHPQPLNQQACLQVLQMLWDAGTGRFADGPSWDKAFAQLCAPGSTHPQCDRYRRLHSGDYKSQVGDTNYAVFADALAYARQAFKKYGTPDFAINTGDFLAHDYHRNYMFYAKNLKKSNGDAPTTEADYTQFVDRTFEFIAWKLEKELGLRMFAALGNNDEYCGDYRILANSGFLGRTAQTLSRYSRSFDDPTQMASFSQGGYYRAQVRDNASMLLILNTTIYAGDHMNPTWNKLTCGLPGVEFCSATFSVKETDTRSDLEAKLAAPVPAVVDHPKRCPQDWRDTQFGWLVSQLLDVRQKGEKAWIVGHVPPGINAFSAVPGSTFMSSAQNDDFAALLANAYLRSSVAGFLAGHTHENEFKLVRSNSGESVGYVLIGPGIDGDHGHNSSFQIFDYDPNDLTVNDIRTFYDNAGVWRELDSYKKAWGHSITSNPAWRGPVEFNPQSLELVFSAMDRNTNLQGVYQAQYYSGPCWSCDASWYAKQRLAICSLTSPCPQAAPQSNPGGADNDD